MKHLKMILALLVFTAGTSHAQMGMGKPKDIKAISQRKMIVILEEPDAGYLAKLEKKNKTNEIATVKTMYENFNAALKQAVADKWTMHQQVEFKTWKEFKRISDKKREKYAVMYFLSKRASSFSSGYVAAKNLILKAEMEEEETSEHNFLSLFQTFTIDKAGDIPVDKWVFGNPVYSITLPEVYPTYISIAYAINSTSTYFGNRVSGKKVNLKSFKKEVADNSTRLQDKTLLIRKDWVADDLTEEKIKSIYPYRIKMVTPEELDAAVRSGDRQYAWLVTLPVINSNSRTNSVIFAQQIVDNSNYDILLFYLPNMGKMMLAAYVGGKAGKGVLTGKTLEGMVEDLVPGPR